MDDIDKRILRVLQTDNQIGMDRLGERIGLSPSAAHRRVKRLRDDGVIRADVSVLEPSAVNRPMTFIVEVTLERESATLYESFKRQMLEAPEVQQCYYVTGDGDFILIITAADLAEYDAITQRLFMSASNIRRFRTSVVMSPVKVSLALLVA
jgi:Lrp/AsnC family leucine-responsive transcriptional regulator